MDRSLHSLCFASGHFVKKRNQRNTQARLPTRGKSKRLNQVKMVTGDS